MTPGSMGIITIRSKNDRGSYYFMSLETGRIIHARQWTVLYVIESMIDRVEQLASDEGINEIVDGDMLFEWNPGEPILLQPYYKEVVPPSNHTTKPGTQGKHGT